MTILVTGGAGFIGSNLIRLLLRETDHERGEIAGICKLVEIHHIVQFHPHYCFEEVDLCDLVDLNRVFASYQPAAVVHLAAESHVDRSIDGPGAFIQTNVVGTCNLLEIARAYTSEWPRAQRSRFRFVHVSTDEVYGTLASGDAGFSEITRYDPHSPYSASKAASDHIARAWHDTYGLPVIVTNCSNNYGPYQFPEKLIPVVILKALRGESIPVYGKGENIRDWLYVEDHCCALRTVIEKGTPGQTYTIGGNNEFRNIDMVNRICEVLDELCAPLARSNSQASPSNQSYKELITFVSDRPGHDRRYAIDASKIGAELNWKAMETIESGLRKTVQWYLENEYWWQAILDGSYRLDRLGAPLSITNP